MAAVAPAGKLTHDSSSPPSETPCHRAIRTADLLDRLAGNPHDTCFRPSRQGRQGQPAIRRRRRRRSCPRCPGPDPAQPLFCSLLTASSSCRRAPTARRADRARAARAPASSAKPRPGSRPSGREKARRPRPRPRGPARSARSRTTRPTRTRLWVQRSERSLVGAAGTAHCTRTRAARRQRRRQSAPDQTPGRAQQARQVPTYSAPRQDQDRARLARTGE